MTDTSPTSQTTSRDAERAALRAQVAQEIPVRRISFADTLEGLSRYFALDGNVAVSHLIVHLSSVFPPGEDFFVRSVRAYRDQITDPVLAEQVRKFIGQEAMHGREHRELNERFDRLGYKTARNSRMTDIVLSYHSRRFPRIMNLGITAALEHYTAVLATVTLDTDLSDAIGHPGVKSILLWHALEECEHKSVAFDVFRHVGGSERVRVATMNLVTFLFLGRMTLLMTESLLVDRESYRRGRIIKDVKDMLARPIFSRRTWKALREYNRPGFHPTDQETDALVGGWRDELFGPDGSLIAYLAAVAPALAAEPQTDDKPEQEVGA